MERRHTNELETVRDLLGHFHTAMLVTGSSELGHHARPMAIAHVDDNCDLWFFTGRRSPKTDEIEHDERVLIAFQDERERYLTIAGRAQLTADRARVRELWKDSFKPWFPGGADDPDLLLIHVRSEQAEYWDSHGAKGIKYLFETAKAYATGERPQIKEGEQHGKVNLR